MANKLSQSIEGSHRLDKTVDPSLALCSWGSRRPSISFAFPPLFYFPPIIVLLNIIS
ncbi:hypothetical protein [Methanomethylovorans sp.]|uniref:hypothetical protein n=1 Tax=Methanomethylovorans sp. TaxID=2758717 RepID=UPI00345EECE8